MQHPDTLARASLDTVCACMPAGQQPARAPVEARRHLIGLAEALPEAVQQAAQRALEDLIEQRFGPQERRAQEVPALAAPALPDIHALLDAAIGDAFATTFDGSDHQAQAIAEHARSEARRVIREHADRLSWIARLRLRGLAKRMIARELEQLFAG